MGLAAPDTAAAIGVCGAPSRVAGRSGSRDADAPAPRGSRAGRLLAHMRRGGSRITKPEDHRVNEEIRVSPVRLIDNEGEQLGIVQLEEAREKADQVGLDLVEVAPDAKPPVVRLMDFGQWKYEQAKKRKEAKKKQHTVEVKQVKFRPKIEEHDFDFKTRHAREFIDDGNKVKVVVMFRYRELRRPELGEELLDRIAEELDDVAQVQSRSGLGEGRNMEMVLVPKGWDV